MTYAKGTSVPVSRSKSELDRLLEKAGAQRRVIGSDDQAGSAFAAFVLEGYEVRLLVPLPKRDEKRFVFLPSSSWRRRTDKQRMAAWEQACRERWRGLVLLLKAKLHAISLGVSTAEREFLADIQIGPRGTSGLDLLAEALSTIKSTYPLLTAGAP